MDGLILLQDASAAGLEVLTDGSRLVVRGPRRAEVVARRLLANKSQVLRALASRTAGIPQVGPDALPGDWRVEWEERAAIREYEGGQARKHAEAEAFTEVLHRMRAAGSISDLT